MSFSRFTKLITKYILSQNDQVSKRPLSFQHVIKLDATLGNLKLANKGTKYPIFGMDIPVVMLNDNIKAFAEYSEYLAKSKRSKPIKSTGRGKGLLTKQGVEIAVERVSIPKRRRSKTVIEEVGQFEEVVDDDVDSDETEDDEEEPLFRRRPTGVFIGGEVHRELDKERVDHSNILKGLETLSEATQFKLNMKKAIKASKDDFFIQQRLQGSGEGSGITLEVPDEQNLKSSNEGAELSKGANSLQAEEQDIPPPTITAMKIPIIRKGEYDIWSMRMRQYICHTDHNLWDVIVNGDLEEEPAPTGETSAPPAPKTAKQLAARRNQERVKSILLLAIPDEYLLKFHNVADAKSLWEAIKSRFGGNEESKKMQKNVLKHQFENFSTASNESLDKAYDRFQKLISQLEVHGAPISKEDINQKFLRSLPPLWNQIALIMRNKPDIDEIDIDDLYNNLRIYEDEMKRSLSSTSTSQNLAFLLFENTSSTNEVSTASGDFGVSTAGGINQVPSTPCAHDIDYYLFAQPTTSHQLENEDFQQIDGDDWKSMAWIKDLGLYSNNSKTDSKISLSIFDVRTSDEESKTTNIDDEDDVSEVQTVNPVKTNDKIGQTSKKAGIGFKKIKACFVWHPEILLQDHAVVDSGCSRHMTGNKAYLSDYED
ncbi:hypothetical protein Tco_0516141 [Tanacetum coccineum]